jgi:hypothetical protein
MEVRGIAREVKHRVAEDHVRKPIWKRHLIDLPDLEVLRRQSGFERSREAAHMVDRLGVGIEREYFAALAKQMDEVSSVAATGVEHSHGGGDVAAQDLIEDVDIDLSELFLNG